MGVQVASTQTIRLDMADNGSRIISQDGQSTEMTRRPNAAPDGHRPHNEACENVLGLTTSATSFLQTQQRAVLIFFQRHRRMLALVVVVFSILFGVTVLLVYYHSKGDMSGATGIGGFVLAAGMMIVAYLLNEKARSWFQTGRPEAETYELE